MGQERKENDGSGHETLSFAEFLSKDAPNAGADRPYLVILEPGQQQYIAPVTRNPTVIGRSSNADVVLADPTVSDFHARVIKHSFGYTLEDMGSAEGTFLSDRRVSHARLVHGDTFRLGGTAFTFMGDVSIRNPVDERATKPLALVPVRTRAMGVASPPLPPAIVDHRSPVQRIPTPAGLPSKSPRAESVETEATIEDMALRILHIYRYLRKNALLITVLIIGGITLGAASFRFLPPVQGAFSLITLYPAPKANPIETESRSEPAESGQFFVNVTESLVSTSNVQTTLQQFGIPNPSDSLADSIASRLKVEFKGHDTYLTTYKPHILDRGGVNPVAFLDTHLRLYIEGEIAKKIKVYVAEVDFLRSQTEAAEKSIKTVSDELVKFREKHADHLMAQGSMQLGSQGQLETRRIDLAGEVHRLSGELNGVRSQLSRGSALTQAKVTAAQSHRDRQSRIKQQITELRAQGYADGHPEVERLNIELRNLDRLIQESISSKVTSFDKQSNVAYDSLQAQADQLESRLRAAQSERSFVETSLSNIRKISTTSPEINAKVDELIRQKDEATRQYQLLFDRLKKAEVRLEVERVFATHRYEIAIPARLDPPPAKKALLLRVLIGFLIGALLAAAVLGLRALREVFRQVARAHASSVGALLLMVSLASGCASYSNFIWVQALPAADRSGEALIHPRDSILVEVQKQPSMSGEFLVRDDGHYIQPLIGSIKVAGLTAGQAALKIGTALKDVVVNPVVAVWITKSFPIRVSVVGEVRTPGTYELIRTRNLLAALAAAGWVTDYAHKDAVFVVRPDNLRIRFRIKDITSSEPATAAFRLNDSDVIVVE